MSFIADQIDPITKDPAIQANPLSRIPKPSSGKRWKVELGHGVEVSGSETIDSVDSQRHSDESTCSSTTSSVTSTSFGGRKSATRIKEMLESVRRRMSNSASKKVKNTKSNSCKLGGEKGDDEDDKENKSEVELDEDSMQALNLGQLDTMISLTNQPRRASLGSNISHTMKLCDCLNNLISFSQKLKLAAEENERSLRLELGKLCLKGNPIGRRSNGGIKNQNKTISDFNDKSIQPFKRGVNGPLAKLPNYIPGRKSIGSFTRASPQTKATQVTSNMSEKRAVTSAPGGSNSSKGASATMSTCNRAKQETAERRPISVVGMCKNQLKSMRRPTGKSNNK